MDKVLITLIITFRGWVNHFFITSHFVIAKLHMVYESMEKNLLYNLYNNTLKLEDV